MSETEKTKVNNCENTEGKYNVLNIFKYSILPMFFVVTVLVVVFMSSGLFFVQGTESDGSEPTGTVSTATNDAEETKSPVQTEATDEATPEVTAPDSTSNVETETPEGESSATPDVTDATPTNTSDQSDKPTQTVSVSATSSSSQTATPSVKPSTSVTSSPNTTTSSSPVQTQKPTPKPTLAGIEGPIVSNGQIIDVEIENNSNSTEKNTQPPNSGEQDDSLPGIENYNNGWSTFFYVLKYIFTAVAILSGSYAIYIVVMFLVVKFKKNKNIDESGKDDE